MGQSIRKQKDKKNMQAISEQKKRHYYINIKQILKHNIKLYYILNYYTV